MLIDLRSDNPAELHGEVAIIGAGAAGMTMARQLVAAGKRVILLESGGLDYEPDTAALNAGTNVGEEYYDLEDSRLRFFGGTTAIWGGRSVEMDPIDFEHRPWVAHSGWPFGIDELRPWYDAAYGLIGLRPLPPGFERKPGVAALGLEGLDVRHWLFDRKFDRFGFAANRDLVEHPNLTVVIHATVREIVAAPGGGAIRSLDARDIGGKRLTVTARDYVLAAGGLENPRILLASNSVCRSGLGNDRDLVGRFFMEHPHARGGRIVGGRAIKLLKMFRAAETGGIQHAPLLTPSVERQRELGILNTSLTVAARVPPGGKVDPIKRAYLYARHTMAPTRRGRSMWKAQRRLKRSLNGLLGVALPWLNVTRGRKEMTLVVRAEQSPNADSRVTLGRETDALGMPRIQLDWRLQDLDVESVSALVDLFAVEAKRHRLGEVVKAEWLDAEPRRWVTDDRVSTHPIGGYHHMGTTRMADDPSRGVTDGWGRVHGIDNLYVAGSSLFPTGGWANPTLTILALALRTADRLAAKG